MVNEADQLSKADYIHNIQYGVREMTAPRFSKPQEVRGGNTRPIKSIAYSCDGKKVATGCDLRGLRIWDAREKMDAATSFSLPSGGEKASPHGGHIASLAWSPVDPNILISGCKNSLSGTYIAVWDIRTPKSPLATHKLPSDILHISFHPSGAHFAVVCPRPQRDEVYFFHRIPAEDGSSSKSEKEKWVRREDVGIGGAGADLGAEEINSLRFSNSGQFLCAVGNDGSLNAWSYPLHPRQLPDPDLDDADDADNEDGPSRAASRAGSRETSPVAGEMEETETEKVAEEGQAQKAGEGEDIVMGEDVAASPSGGKGLHIDTSAANTTLSAQSLATIPPPTPSRPASPLSKPSARSFASHPSQPSRLPTAASSTSQSIQLRRIKHSIIHSASLLALGFDPTGKYLAVGGQDALLSVFTTRDWICVRTFDISTGAIRHISFSPDGEMIAFGGDDQNIYIVSVHSGQTLAKLPVAATVNALAWHPSKNWLAYSVVSKGTIAWYVVQQE